MYVALNKRNQGHLIVLNYNNLGESFYEFNCGGFMRNYEIDEHLSRISTFGILSDEISIALTSNIS